jgi:hypothetical protein
MNRDLLQVQLVKSSWNFKYEDVHDKFSVIARQQR